MTMHNGGCHCGAVRFQFEAPARIDACRCNCSICSMTGFLHVFVSRKDFRLLTDDSALTTYTFNTRTAKHLFCCHCGVKSFYVPRSHPNAYSVNLNCVEPATVAAVDVTDFDGRHWEQAISGLSPISD